MQLFTFGQFKALPDEPAEWNRTSSNESNDHISTETEKNVRIMGSIKAFCASSTQMTACCNCPGLMPQLITVTTIILRTVSEGREAVFIDARMEYLHHDPGSAFGLSEKICFP